MGQWAAAKGTATWQSARLLEEIAHLSWVLLTYSTKAGKCRDQTEDGLDMGVGFLQKSCID